MDEGVDPKDMCQSLVADVIQDAEIEEIAVPEIRALFKDWMEELDQEIWRLIAAQPNITPEKLAKEFRISKEAAAFLLRRKSMQDAERE